MQLPVEILDHIFSFLSHQEALVACAKAPGLSLIVERHLYYHTTVHINATFERDHLPTLVSANPRILHYVRILKVQVDPFYDELLDEFASTFLMFPVLECIMLIGSTNAYGGYLPAVFRAALEDRIRLPTLKEVHLTGWVAFPFSLLDNGKNIESLSLSGYFNTVIPASETLSSALPQLKTLRLFTSCIHPWVIVHVSGLRSLKYLLSSGIRCLSKLLKVCSKTLNTLDLDLQDSPFFTRLDFRTGEIGRELSLSELSLPSLNVHRLTIRTCAELIYVNQNPRCCNSWLITAAEAINLFLSSLRHLVIDFNIIVSTLPDLTLVDLSSLAEVLETASLTVPHIDLYIHTGISTPAPTRAQLFSLLDYEEMTGLVQKGVLVIHSEETAPECV